jgi:hypothetical protein
MLPGSWNESSSTAGTAAAVGSQASSRGPRAQFIKGTGTRSSFMYSTSSVTGVTKAEAARITAALKKRAAALPGNSIHCLMTGNGSPYQNIQARIM